MKAFVEFLHHDLAGNLTKPCGSDSVFVLDGRCLLLQHIADAEGALERRSRAHPDWVGYRIVAGTLREPGKVLYQKNQLEDVTK